MSNPYLRMRPETTLYEIPNNALQKLLPYFETVHRASEWNALGFPASVDECAVPREGRSKTYRFWAVDVRDPVIAEGIRTGCKVECHPLFVAQYILAGCNVGDFVTLPEDVILFCEAKLLYNNGKCSEALPLLKRAIDLQHDENTPAVHLRLYGETYYSIRLELNDPACIDEELEFFQSDIDILVHTGKVEKWIKTLAMSNEFSHARTVIERVDALLQKLAEGMITPRFFARQSLDWYSYKREQFSKAAMRYQVKGVCEGCAKSGGVVSRIESGQWVCRSCLREIHGGNE